MVTQGDMKNLLRIGRNLADTDELFVSNMIGYQEGVRVGFMLAMAIIQGTDVQMESISDFFRREKDKA